MRTSVLRRTVPPPALEYRRPRNAVKSRRKPNSPMSTITSIIRGGGGLRSLIRPLTAAMTIRMKNVRTRMMSPEGKEVTAATSF